MSREQQLAGQTLVVVGGSSSIGLETARRTREEGAGVILTARNPDRLHRAGLELGASIAAFDATDFDRLEKFFDELPTPIGVPPGRILLAASRATCSASKRCASTSRRAFRSRSPPAGRRGTGRIELAGYGPVLVRRTRLVHVGAHEESVAPVYEVAIETIFAFRNGSAFGRTRWRFGCGTPRLGAGRHAARIVERLGQQTRRAPKDRGL